MTHTATPALRRELYTEYDLPMGEKYREFIVKLLDRQNHEHDPD